MPRASTQEECLSPTRPKRSTSKQLTEDLTKEELLKRFKTIARDLYDVGQGQKPEDYHELATTLGKTFIMKHNDKDVRLFGALCITHILRICAPHDPPYKNKQLWSVFDLIISSLEGIKTSKVTTSSKMYDLLENLSYVRTLNICIHMEYNDLILKVFKILLSSVKEVHSVNVKGLMVDIMSTLAMEAESISQELLDTILENIVDPKKTSNPASYALASSLIQRAAIGIEPYIQMFFNSSLFLDKSSESILNEYMYELIYELYKICPNVLMAVLPQLELKLKSGDEAERLEVTIMMAKMFSDEESLLAKTHRSLWQSYRGRFIDINANIRIECTKHAKNILMYHPDLLDDISDELSGRQRDPDEKVRMEVVTTICEAASEKIDCIPEKLFNIVTERLRDRKLNIRKDTMMYLGMLYKKIAGSDDVNNNDMKKFSWITTKILHCYYQNSAEDRLCVERVFLGHLVPLSLPSEDRMKRMLTLYQRLDDAGVKAINFMFKTRASLRSDLNDILRLWQDHQTSNSDETKKLLAGKIAVVAKVLPDPVKAQEHLKKIANMLSDKKFYELMKTCVGSGQDSAKVSKAVGDVAIKFGAKNPMFETIKAVLDRAPSLLIDSLAAKHLVNLVSGYVDDENIDDDDDDDDDEDPDSTRSSQDEITMKGCQALDLLQLCVECFPAEFQCSLIYEKMLVYLKRKDYVANKALHMLTHIGEGLEKSHSELSSHYQQILTKLFTNGTLKQTKLAGLAICKIYSSYSTIFERILKSQLNLLDSKSSKLPIILSCISQIAILAPTIFHPHYTTIIRDFVIKELLTKDKNKSSKTASSLWCDESELSNETAAKIQGVKLLVNWLRGLQTKDQTMVLPVLRILDSVFRNNGDITGRGRVRLCDMSHMRLVAACGFLKLAREDVYHEFIDIEYIQNLSSIMQDRCNAVRKEFLKHLRKGVESLKLPLEYLTLLALSAMQPSKDEKQQVKQIICRCINNRRAYLKQNSSAAAHSALIMPEYGLPYLIYLLSHLPGVDYNENESFKDIKTYLCFFMEPLLTRGDNYNFLKKLAEQVKQTKDAKAPDDEDVNNAMYTVCDIAIEIIMTMSKTHTFFLKDYPGNLVLPKKLFTLLSQDELNNKSYLPKDFVISPIKKTSVSTQSKPGQSSHSSSSKRKVSSSDKKHKRRVSETSKPKKIQKSLSDMLAKEIKEKQEESEEEEEEEEDEGGEEKEEVARKESRSPAKQTTSKATARKKLTSPSRKRSSTSSSAVTSPTKKRPKKAPEKEENPTRFSPRRTASSAAPSSPVAENTRRNTRRGDISEATKNLANDFSDESSKVPFNKRTKDSLDDSPAMNGFSHSSPDDSQNGIPATNETRSPVKKHKTREEIHAPAVLEKSSLVVKRIRKRR